MIGYFLMLKWDAFNKFDWKNINIKNYYDRSYVLVEYFSIYIFNDYVYDRRKFLCRFMLLSALVLWRRCLTLVFGIIAQRENTRPRLVTNGYISISFLSLGYMAPLEVGRGVWKANIPTNIHFFSLGSCAMSLFPPRVCCNGVESSILDSTCPSLPGSWWVHHHHSL